MMMENEEEIQFPTEALRLYFKEVKDLQHEPEYEIENVHMNEVEQATDFLQKAGLTDLTKIYNQGYEISDKIFNESIRQRDLTEKQANTVKSRVETLNKTLRKKQYSKKQRQDVRDVTWNLETSSTGTRSRSETPDSLDFGATFNEDLNSDDDQNVSLPPQYNNEDDGNNMSSTKTKLKFTNSNEQGLQGRFLNKHDFGDVAHLGSKNVVLMGYHPIRESSNKKNKSEDVRNESTIMNDINNTTTTLIESSKNILMGNLLNTDNQNVVIEPKQNPSSSDSELLSFESLTKSNDEILDVLDGIVLDDGSIKIEDVPDSDYQYLKPLLHLEVTTIFDKHQISIVRRKSTGKCKRGNVFGVKLTTLVMRDLEPSDTMIVPQLYQILLNTLNKYVKEEGILRIAGNKQRMDQICSDIENNFYSKHEHVVQTILDASPHELTGILKKLLRELPDPIFTMELIDMFYKTYLIKDSIDKMRVLNLLVLLLPIEHRNTFKILQEFFIEVIKNENFNRMGRHNVAMIITPAFFQPNLFVPKELNKLDKTNLKRVNFEINLAALCSNIMEMLLCAGEKLFFVPNELYNQAKQAKQKALDRKLVAQEKDSRAIKKKLQRSSTQYEPGATLSPRIKRDFI